MAGGTSTCFFKAMQPIHPFWFAFCNLGVPWTELRAEWDNNQQDVVKSKNGASARGKRRRDRGIADAGRWQWMKKERPLTSVVGLSESKKATEKKS